jgi:6-phosphogluconate dehydrogenase
MTQSFGLIGLAVMGENLALNIERNGFPITVYNRTPKKQKPSWFSGAR